MAGRQPDSSCVLDGKDFQGFETCMMGSMVGDPPVLGRERADVNGDSLADTNDTDAFVALLVAGDMYQEQVPTPLTSILNPTPIRSVAAESIDQSSKTRCDQRQTPFLPTFGRLCPIIAQILRGIPQSRAKNGALGPPTPVYGSWHGGCPKARSARGPCRGDAARLQKDELKAASLDSRRRLKPYEQVRQSSHGRYIPM